MGGPVGEPRIGLIHSTAKHKLPMSYKKTQKKQTLRENITKFVIFKLPFGQPKTENLISTTYFVLPRANPANEVKASPTSGQFLNKCLTQNNLYH